MPDMTLHAKLLDRIEAYCAHHGLTEGQFGHVAANDRNLVERLRSGKDILKRTESRILSALKRRPPPTRRMSKKTAAQAKSA